MRLFSRKWSTWFGRLPHSNAINFHSLTMIRTTFVNRLLKACIATCLSIFLLTPEFAFSEGGDPQARMSFILKDTLRFNSTLTQEVHNEFWSLLNLFSKREQKNFLETTRVTIFYATLIHHEVLKSALLSYRKKKVTRTAELVSLTVNYRKKFTTTLPTTLSDAAKRAAIENFDLRFKKSKINNDLFLEAAAKHQTFQIPDRGGIEMTEENLKSLAMSIQPTVNRMMKLLNPVWLESP